MRLRGRTDSNQERLVSALRAAGCRVLSLAALGSGVPDLLVLRAGRLYLLEVKDGAKPPSKRRLTAEQRRFHQFWPVAVVTSPEEALQAVGVSRALV